MAIAKSIVLAGIGIGIFAACLFAQPTHTTVTESVYAPQTATPETGTVTFQLTASCFQGSVYVSTAPIAVSYSGGVFTVGLVPTDSCPTQGTGVGTAWLIGTAYTAGARVTYNGSVWLARAGSTGVTPGSAPTIWLLISPVYTVTWTPASPAGPKRYESWAVPTSGSVLTIDQVRVSVSSAVSVPVPGPQGQTATISPVWARRGVVLYPDPTLPNPRGVGEPTVLVEGNPVVLTGYTPVWKMWYSNAGTEGIYYAESLDGVNWTSYVGSGTYGQVVSNHQRGYVIKNGSTYYMYASLAGDMQIDEYTSSDGVTFSLANSAVIADGMGAWNTGQNTNSGGIVIGGTLYLFVEHAGIGIGLFTSTDFHTFTPVSLAISNGLYCCQSAPSQINGTWYMWIATDLSPCVINRWSAPAITGPWTIGPVEISPASLDEGVGGTSAQTTDPWIMEVNGQTYLYYTSNQQVSAAEYVQVKLAVAKMPMAVLVTSAGGAEPSEQQSDLGLSFDYANNAVNTHNRNIETGVGTVTTGGLRVTNTSATALDWYVPTNGIVGKSSTFGLLFGTAGIYVQNSVGGQSVRVG